jgi:NAD/NADP transhydrogenase beta subunit
MVGPSGSILTYVLADTFVSAVLVAVICTGFCPGKVAGAV